MTEIKVQTSDGKIWNREKIIAELIRASLLGPVTINLLNEGPCCQSVGLDNILDDMVTKFDLDKNLYTIYTSNQIPSSAYKEIRSSFVELEFMQQNAREIKHSDHPLEKHFGFFVSRSNWLRLALASYCHARCLEKMSMTYHYDHTLDYHICHFGLEQFINKHWNDIDQVTQFLKKLPITIGNYSYPIRWNEMATELNFRYKDFFCDIVCETFFSGHVFFMTEKTMRAIINKKPFLIQGPQWFLKNLKRLGFKTFDRWWDEGYDEDPWDFRYEGLKINIDYIADQDLSTINRWHAEMKPILDHNYDVFMKLTANQIIETEFYV